MNVGSEWSFNNDLKACFGSLLGRKYVSVISYQEAINCFLGNYHLDFCKEILTFMVRIMIFNR